MPRPASQSTSDTTDTAPTVSVGTYSPVMGTTLEIVIEPAGLAEQAERVALAEIDRLSAVLSGHDGASELSRWRRSECDQVTPELGTVLAAAQWWHARTGGAFHPATGALRHAWSVQAARGRSPARAQLRHLARAHRRLPYETRPGPDGTVEVERTGDCLFVDLDGLAKGFVVDAAVAAVGALDDVHSVTVNAGGDLRHAGRGGRRVRIEDPRAPFDNAPGLTTIEVTGAALATSSSARRGFSVAGRWFGHVLDPRTGRPADQAASASVLAPDAMTADAAATTATVLAPGEALTLIDQLGLACLLVEQDGTVHRSPTWPVAEVLEG